MRTHDNDEEKAEEREAGNIATLGTRPIKARIEALYEVKAQRIEPVGLVYLWPVTG